MPEHTHNLRVRGYRPLAPPALLHEELPLTKEAETLVGRARQDVIRVFDGEDDRLLVVVGPCSIHDPEAAVAYASRLRKLANELADDLYIVMRVYFEKPRTTVGWKGLINDPYLDGSCASNHGLRLARRLLLELSEVGIPAGCEFLDPVSPQFIADAVTWGAIGARTTESQVHRQLASGLSMPVGFKNGTDGGVQVSIDAIRAAASPHGFFGVTEQGSAAIVDTTGNPDCHVILRGGRGGHNHREASVQDTLAELDGAGLPRRVMIDASHGNSSNDYLRQSSAAREIAAQIEDGEQGIIGVMLESFLVDGRQDLVDKTRLVYGQSVTDSCMGWDTTAVVLHDLAQAVRARRGSQVDSESGELSNSDADYKAAIG